MVAGIRFVRRITARLKQDGLIAEEELPGRHLQSDAELRTSCATTPGATTRPAPARSDPASSGGVLSSDFRVHGTRGLRVVDASVFPRIPGFFPVSAVYMVAEKAADAILAGRAQLTRRRPQRSDGHGVRRPQLLTMSQEQLDDLFTKSPAGDIPDGEARAPRSSRPGSKYSSDIATIVSHFAWQGKTFDGKKGVLKNRILPFGLNAIMAKVYKAPSWLDGKECIVLDYSETSLVARWIRDEIRQIGPGLYLGKVYWGKKRLIDFALKF